MGEVPLLFLGGRAEVGTGDAAIVCLFRLAACFAPQLEGA
jgi:hypothetical protein